MSGGTGKGTSARGACRALGLLFDAEGGRVVFITGNEKGCGKTSLLSWAAAERSGRGMGSRFLSSGFDTAYGGSGGELDVREGFRFKEGVRANSGDLVLTAESLIRGFPGRFEILERFNDRTSGEWFVCVRIARAGVIPLLGPRDPALLRRGIESLLRFEGQGPVMVDGPAGRLTQIAVLPEASFVHVLRVTPETKGTALAEALRLSTLSRLPLFDEVGRAGGQDAETCDARAVFIPGALTEPTLRGLPKDTDTVVVEDFTKVFCAVVEAAAIPRIFVKRVYPLLGIVLNPRGLDLEETTAEFSARTEMLGIPVFPHPLFLDREVEGRGR